MSYILDALRKSEQERRRGELPDPRDFSQAPASNVRQQRWLWPALGVGLLLVNAIGVVVYLAPWQPPVSTSTQVQRPVAVVPNITPVPKPVPEPRSVRATPAPRQQVRPTATALPTARMLPTATMLPTAAAVPTKAPLSTAQSAPAVNPAPTPATQDYRNAQPNTSTVTAATNSARRNAGRSVPQLDELPANLRSQLPELSFSSHMYSSTARYRSIIINGRRLKEGQLLSADLAVHEITETGVIMQFNDTRFEVDVLSQW
jgi:general secretion pathway protein B